MTPTPLTAIYLEALADDARPRLATSGVDLEQPLIDLIALASAAWPDLPVDPSRFVAHLARHARNDGSPPGGHAADLYLAFACLGGAPGALNAFEAVLRDVVAQAAAPLKVSPSFVDELTQVLRHKLLTQTGDDGPKIAAYAGQSALTTWLYVVTKRTALNMMRAPVYEEVDDADVADLISPELSYMKSLYKTQFEEASRRAFAKLAAKQRALLQMYVVDRMTLAQIAAVYDVSHASVARWLSAARDALVHEMRHEVCATLSLSTSEYESVARLIRSELRSHVLALVRAEP